MIQTGFSQWRVWPLGIVAIQYSPWRWFRPEMLVDLAQRHNRVAIQYSPWRWFRHNLTIRRDNKIRIVAIQYSPWRWFRLWAILETSFKDELSRNPVFALEMIQTIIPGPHHFCWQKVAIQYSPWRWFRRRRAGRQEMSTELSRNPVFALEMIQTHLRHHCVGVHRAGRNPVFALEMIQTWRRKKFSRKEWNKVAIQYSPWRWFRQCRRFRFFERKWLVAIQYSPWRWFRQKVIFPRW